MNIMVLAPHPDDDALGCGGAIRKHVLAGDQVQVVYVTSGELGCPGQDPMTTIRMREAEAGVCSQVLQTQRVDFLRFPDGELQRIPDLKSFLATFIEKAMPDLIYAPHPGEEHPDHAVVGAIAADFGSRLADVRLYEVWTPVQKVDYCIDITALATTKRNAIRAYASQVARNGFDEAMLALNHYRGMMHGPEGPVMYAEAFGVA